MPTTDTSDTSAPVPAITVGVVALDTDEPRRLADFYAALLGWEVTRSADDWVEIHPSTGSGDGATGLAFQLVIDYVPPTWPTQDVPQQIHLDLDVADLDAGEQFALSVGARRVKGPKSSTSFRVFLDPSGHPFCLCQAG
ncbi:MAG: VOC family protein [Propionibacteriaceae bacterium]